MKHNKWFSLSFFFKLKSCNFCCFERALAYSGAGLELTDLFATAYWMLGLLSTVLSLSSLSLNKCTASSYHLCKTSAISSTSLHLGLPFLLFPGNHLCVCWSYATHTLITHNHKNSFSILTYIWNSLTLQGTIVFHWEIHKSTYLSGQGHLDSVTILVIRHNATTNVCAQISVWTLYSRTDTGTDATYMLDFRKETVKLYECASRLWLIYTLVNTGYCCHFTFGSWRIQSSILLWCNLHFFTM